MHTGSALASKHGVLQAKSLSDHVRPTPCQTMSGHSSVKPWVHNRPILRQPSPESAGPKGSTQPPAAGEGSATAAARGGPSAPPQPLRQAHWLDPPSQPGKSTCKRVIGMLFFRGNCPSMQGWCAVVLLHEHTRFDQAVLQEQRGADQVYPNGHGSEAPAHRGFA
eukprot:1161734-Pelagomonas_calceolata.AAC.19